MTDDRNEQDVAFGFRRVREGEKQGLVNEVFSKVAERYDQMNDLMSGGLHRLWKDDFVAMLNPPRGQSAFNHLDVAGGTGDIAFRILRSGGPNVRVTVADISPEMVGEGRERAETDGLLGRCSFTVGNAEALAFPDKSFDGYSIAFGIRNVTHIGRALAEAYRVLKPGGHFLCLEFSQVDVPLMDKVYDAYSFTVVPAIGKVVTGDGHPYREDAGFSNVSYRNLTGGVVAIHSGWRV